WNGARSVVGMIEIVGPGRGPPAADSGSEAREGCPRPHLSPRSRTRSRPPSPRARAPPYGSPGPPTGPDLADRRSGREPPPEPAVDLGDHHPDHRRGHERHHDEEAHGRG